METPFEIVVETLPAKQIPVLRTIRAISGYGLKEAKALLTYTTSNCPCVLLAGVNQTMAENIANQLSDAGATTKIQASSISTPMLICPKLDKRYEDHWLFGLRSRDSA